MSTQIAVYIYSGYKNPQIRLTLQQEQVFWKKVIEVTSERPAKWQPKPTMFGYCGFGVNYMGIDMRLPKTTYLYDGCMQERITKEVLFSDPDRYIEKWLFEIVTPYLKPWELELIRQKVFHDKEMQYTVQPKEEQRDDARFFIEPEYDADRWNHDDHVCQNNNAYNYATNMMTNTFAQPSWGSGLMGGPNLYSLDGIVEAAQIDGLEPVEAVTDYPPEGAHYVCLVFHKELGYHWYRYHHRLGLWAHKPGPMPVTNKAYPKSKQPITDMNNPQHYAPFTHWGGYFLVYPKKVRIA